MVKNLDKVITEKTNNKKNSAQPPVKSGEDSKSTQPTLIKLRPTSPPPPKAQPEKVQKPPHSKTPPTPISKEDLQNIPDDDDDKTVNNDTFSVSDTLKSSFVEAHEILDKYKNEKQGYNIKDKKPTDFKRLNELCDKILNKPKGTNQWATLRKLSDMLHYGQPLTYVKPKKK